MKKPTIRDDVLRLLQPSQIGPMAVNELALCLPHVTVKSIRNTLNTLLSEWAIHMVNRHAVHPKYALGAPPDGMSQPHETREARRDREYRLLLNYHLRPEWTPEPDPVAVAWMLTPIPVEELNHVE